MEKMELAKKALESISGADFDCYFYATTGGKCGDGWNYSDNVFFSTEELRGLVDERLGREGLFDDLETEYVDVDEKLSEMIPDLAWPDGGPRPFLTTSMPEELSELDAELKTLDANDAKAGAEMREKLQAVEGGKYTFTFEIADGGHTYFFAEDVHKEIELTAEEALGLLRGQHDIPEVFDGICDKTYDDDMVEEKAKEMGFASDYDSFSYGGYSDAIDTYLDSWEELINGIFDGEITEENLEDWLEYFDDPSNFNDDIMYFVD